MSRVIHLLDQRTPPWMHRQVCRLAGNDERVLLLDTELLGSAQVPVVEVRSVLPTIQRITTRHAARHLGETELIHAWGLRAGKRALSIAKDRRVLVSLPGMDVIGVPDDLPWRIAGMKFDVTLPTAADREALIAAGGDPRRIHVLPPAGRATSESPERIKELRDHFAPHGQPLCVVVGELTDHSGGYQASWVHAILSHIQPNVRILFSRPGPGRKRVETFLHNNGNDDMASILDLTIPTADVLATADVLMLFDQGASNAGDFADALAAAKPILATDLPGYVDLADTGQAALLAPTTDIRQAAGNLLRLLENTDEICADLSARAADAAKALAAPVVRATLDTIYTPTP
ncbi:MAG: hypothetical protein HN909_05920 [Phycisphaerales bacterium]|jgi:hypothetical protein|nr:hypothetical protein [Phycisphaerales bacterium]MBT7171291.1 hypothetical protein [Phycisphaerales bacterium]